MKYAIIIPDGAADHPQPALGNRTPLEIAEIPNMHYLIQHGQAGRAATVPAGLAPGSDVANLSILGYDPALCYSGRAPLEAASLGISLQPGEAVFRANTVCIGEDGSMADFAGGHPTDAETVPLLHYLDEGMEIPGVKLHHGVSYRHLCVVPDMAGRIPATTPPHDITGKPAAPHLPQDELLNRIMRRSAELLRDWPGNGLRRQKNKPPLSQLWLWGGGVMPSLKTYRELYDVSGAMISAVDLLRGIGRLAGLEILRVPGATAYYDTNYAGKGAAALSALERLDMVVVHVEAPDEAGHNGHPQEKVRALENIDRHIVAPLLRRAQEGGDMRILCLPDHPTPLELRTHCSEPVPYALYGPGILKRPAMRFTERAVAELPVIPGPQLPGLLFSRC